MTLTEEPGQPGRRGGCFTHRGATARVRGWGLSRGMSTGKGRGRGAPGPRGDLHSSQVVTSSCTGRCSITLSCCHHRWEGWPVGLSDLLTPGWGAGGTTHCPSPMRAACPSPRCPPKGPQPTARAQRQPHPCLRIKSILPISLFRRRGPHGQG